MRIPCRRLRPCSGQPWWARPRMPRHLTDHSHDKVAQSYKVFIERKKGRKEGEGGRKRKRKRRKNGRKEEGSRERRRED